ncbi:aspartate-alanine antiporter [Mycolicibacterium septicum DSM 44393]|uniref:Aspartate-alanine antiporter n=1 Tax=Mycolicibacterium septicum DSM 44393 TaxID=1341646 RepID=A0A7X6MMA6_9MYCO|nr:aspartate-alanine antiporter [Mycolicibacterium septicum]NKZ10398.1 aspartate-alanine antiporter [Mycolicibacterium septicum DSM 44393]
MHNIARAFIDHPEIPIFLALAGGYFFGRFQYKGLGLGAVTATLLCGVILGAVFQTGGDSIHIDGVVKQVFFLLFLFALGYKLGPQFFSGLKGDGLPQAVFTVILIVVGLATVIVLAKVLDYDPGLAAGLASGALTQSAIIGVAQTSIADLNIGADTMRQWQDLVSVGYAVTYIFGTIGAAIYCGSIAPRLLGIRDLPASAKDLEKKLGFREEVADVLPAYDQIVRRSYRIVRGLPERHGEGMTVTEIEDFLRQETGGRVSIAQVRHDGKIVPAAADLRVFPGDDVAVSGRREWVIGGPITDLCEEVDDPDLLSYPLEELDVVLTKHSVDGMTIGQASADPDFRGVYLKRIMRAGHEIPIASEVKLRQGDEVRLVGERHLIENTVALVGYPERTTPETDMVTVGLGVAVGALIGLPTLMVENIPLSLTTSVGALLMGLLIGWRRSKSPTFGRIPPGAQWFFEGVGLTAFIAIVGITSGPGFIKGLQNYGVSLFLAGVVVTMVPLVLMTFMARYVFKFDPVLTLGMLTGAQTTTAAVGSVREAAKSSVPLLGFTVPYAIGNIFLSIGGAVVVAFMA